MEPVPQVATLAEQLDINGIRKAFVSGIPWDEWTVKSLAIMFRDQVDAALHHLYSKEKHLLRYILNQDKRSESVAKDDDVTVNLSQDTDMDGSLDASHKGQSNKEDVKSEYVLEVEQETLKCKYRLDCMHTIQLAKAELLKYFLDTIASPVSQQNIIVDEVAFAHNALASNAGVLAQKMKSYMGKEGISRMMKGVDSHKQPLFGFEYLSVLPEKQVEIFTDPCTVIDAAYISNVKRQVQDRFLLLMNGEILLPLKSCHPVKFRAFDYTSLGMQSEEQIKALSRQKQQQVVKAIDKSADSKKRKKLGDDDKNRKKSAKPDKPDKSDKPDKPDKPDSDVKAVQDDQ